MKLKLKDIKPNPDNPRVLRDNKYSKLKQSIQDFPEMLELRPIVIDENNYILGGNMRYRILQELGYKETFVVKANDLTEAQKKEFTIKDNLNYGEWDWDILANWDNDLLDTWGLDLPVYEPMNKERELDEIETNNECPSCGYKW